jgi:hypothetical protein
MHALARGLFARAKISYLRIKIRFSKCNVNKLCQSVVQTLFASFVGLLYGSINWNLEILRATATVESDFSIINWTKNLSSQSLTDFSWRPFLIASSSEVAEVGSCLKSLLLNIHGP